MVKIYNGKDNNNWMNRLKNNVKSLTIGKLMNQLFVNKQFSCIFALLF